MPVKPPNRPRLSRTNLHARIAQFKIDREKHPVIIVGIRGYYRDSMGQPDQNDRGIYDDALFIDSPSATIAYNGNTDPSVVRKKTSRKKGMARLKPGAYLAHRIDVHGGSVPHEAVCQRMGKVTVIRDGNPDYEDTGSGFGINIHRGSKTSTSSEGCQTIPPDQWDSFIATVKAEMKKHFGAKYKTTVIPYILIEEE